MKQFLPQALLGALLSHLVCASAFALPPQELRTVYYADALHRTALGFVTVHCSGQCTVRGRVTGHAVTKVVRGCGTANLPAPGSPCEFEPDDLRCRNLPRLRP